MNNWWLFFCFLFFFCSHFVFLVPSVNRAVMETGLALLVARIPFFMDRDKKFDIDTLCLFYCHWVSSSQVLVWSEGLVR